jgi:putative membrane protein
MKQKSFASMLAVGLLALAPAFGQSAQGQGAQSQGSQSQGSKGSQGQGSQAGQSGSGQGQSGQAGQQGAGSAARTGSANRMGADSAFAMKAAMGGMAEVKLGQLAADKASNQDVKSFAQQMVQDHSRANDELKQLVSSKGVTLPADLDPKHQATYDRLAKMSGAEFDRAYMQEMVKDHRETVNDFRRESKSGSDAELKAWAEKTLPTLEGHLKEAESVNGKMKK